MNLIDTHCHIHEITGSDSSDHSVANKWHKAGVTNAEVVIADAVHAGVSTLICVGTTVADSQSAIDFVKQRSECYASIGVHPHESTEFVNNTKQIANFLQFASKPKVVAVGECGLDYFYNHSVKADQIRALELQLQLAQDSNLPVIFHVREAFDDFWPIFDNFKGIRGVIHSFTDNRSVLDQIIKRKLFVGLNGIITFTKQDSQLKMAKSVPLEFLLLETDAPFLTPEPFRGRICTPKHIGVTAEFLSNLRGESLADLAQATTNNAKTLFSL
jgi:TatD DNase family protein